jgi:hypothetical protein
MTVYLFWPAQTQILLRSRMRWLNGDSLAKMFLAMNKDQMERGLPVHCVDSHVTSYLLRVRADPNAFAKKLISIVLGQNPDLFPNALVFAMHAEECHFLTLLLHALERKLYVFDSLISSSATWVIIKELATALRLNPEEDVIRGTMTMQDESVHCLPYVVGAANGLRQSCTPHDVSSGVSWFCSQHSKH